MARNERAGAARFGRLSRKTWWVIGVGIALIAVGFLGFGVFSNAETGSPTAAPDLGGKASIATTSIPDREEASASTTSATEPSSEAAPLQAVLATAFNAWPPPDLPRSVPRSIVGTSNDVPVALSVEATGVWIWAFATEVWRRSGQVHGIDSWGPNVFAEVETVEVTGDDSADFIVSFVPNDRFNSIVSYVDEEWVTISFTPPTGEPTKDRADSIEVIDGTVFTRENTCDPFCAAGNYRDFEWVYDPVRTTFAGAAIDASSELASDDSRPVFLSGLGIGEAMIGMAAADAVAILETQLGTPDERAENECYWDPSLAITTLKWGPLWVYLSTNRDSSLFSGWTMSSRLESGRSAASGITTSSGIGLASSVEDIWTADPGIEIEEWLPEVFTGDLQGGGILLLEGPNDQDRVIAMAAYVPCSEDQFNPDFAAE